MSDAHKELTRRFSSLIWNEKDVTRLDELVTEDYTVHVGGGSFSGRDTMRAVANQWFASFPDLRVDVLQQVAGPDRVADYLLFSGTHTGCDYHPGLFRAMGLPPIPTSGKPFEFTQTCVTRIDDGLMGRDMGGLRPRSALDAAGRDAFGARELGGNGRQDDVVAGRTCRTGRRT